MKRLLEIVRRRIEAPELSSDREKQDRSERIEIYKLIVEMADRVSQRRQAANSFYLSVNAFLLGGSAYLKGVHPVTGSVVLICLAGVFSCVYWVRSIESYKSLNATKFSVINEIENRLIEKPFSTEWESLSPDTAHKNHKPFHSTERLVPKLFILVYGWELTRAIHWAGFIRAFEEVTCKLL